VIHVTMMRRWSSSSAAHRMYSAPAASSYLHYLRWSITPMMMLHAYAFLVGGGASSFWQSEDTCTTLRLKGGMS
jgi:hypothetical protein